MVCFPESAATGYALRIPKILQRARNRPHQGSFGSNGAGHENGAGCGAIENTGKRPFMAQLITGPEGLMGIYRKTHLSPTESEIYDAGETLGVFVYGGWCFGLQLCYEAHFPEISTKMALSGADFVDTPRIPPG
jgi:predicted amidohydrolase